MINPKYFYHSTSANNLKGILNSLMLKPCVGIPIAGYENDFVSLSDYLNDYLFVIFGNVIIEFNFEKIISKNNLVPRVYNAIIDFEDMPFEECEWVANKVAFQIEDIKKIYFVKDKYNLDYLVVKDLCLNYTIDYKETTREKLPIKELDFYKKRYFNRIQKYGLQQV